MSSYCFKQKLSWYKIKSIFFRTHMRTGEYNIVSAHRADMARSREFLGKMFSIYFINMMSSWYFKHILSWNSKISIICTTKKNDWWVLFGRKLSHIMEQLRPKSGNPLVFFVYLYLINIMSYQCFKQKLSWHRRK